MTLFRLSASLSEKMMFSRLKKKSSFVRHDVVMFYYFIITSDGLGTFNLKFIYKQ